MDSAVYFLISSKWSQFSILGIFTIYALRKVRERAANRKIQLLYASRIEMVRRERAEHVEWAKAQSTLTSLDDKRRIEGMDFAQLREALQLGEVSSEAVIRVYYGVAVKAHEKTNCLTNIIKEALDEARRLDGLAKDPSYMKPRLFGMPISIKDSTELAGHRNTWALAKCIDKIPKEDSYQVMKLRMEGMIPFCQTNLPPGCMAYTCINSIFGTTTCPHSPSRTSGGSSGGEGALIASGGSLIGIGSDVAGSIRIPAAYSGCSGFKPSSTRFSLLHIKDPLPLMPPLMFTEGPLAQDPHAIVEVMRAMWSDRFLSTLDALTVAIDFREDLFEEGRKYRVGYYSSDGYIDPLPGNRRVVEEAAELLRTKGHDVVPFSLADIAAETARGVFALAMADGGAKIAETLKNEPLHPSMAAFRSIASIPYWVTKLIGWMCKMQGDSNTADFFLYQSRHAVDVEAGLHKISACRKRLIQKMKDEKIDILLCPSTLSPALPHALPLELPFTAMLPTMLWNAMDFPAGVVTTGSWNEQDEAALESYPEKGLVEKGIKKGSRSSVGLPLSVQIVAPAFRDESVLRVMVDLHDAVNEAEKSGNQ